MEVLGVFGDFRFLVISFCFKTVSSPPTSRLELEEESELRRIVARALCLNRGGVVVDFLPHETFLVLPFLLLRPGIQSSIAVGYVYQACILLPWTKYAC